MCTNINICKTTSDTSTFQDTMKSDVQRPVINIVKIFKSSQLILKVIETINYKSKACHMDQ